MSSPFGSNLYPATDSPVPKSAATDEATSSWGVLVLKGETYVISSVDALILTLWGRTESQVLGKPLFEALPELSGQGFETLLAGVYTTGVPFMGKEMPGDLERNGQRERIYTDFIYLPIRDESGQITGITVVATDVTLQVQARQRALLESEQREQAALALARQQRDRFYSLFMQAPAMIAIVRGEEMVYELVNPFYQQLFPDRDLLGKPLLEAVPEIKDQPIMNILHGVYQSGEDFTGNELPVELDISGKGVRETVYFNFIYQATRDPSGKVDGIITYAYNVTELVKARQTIEENASRIQQILDSLPLIAWTTSAEGKNNHVNQQWYAYTGSSPDTPFDLRPYLHPEDVESTISQWFHCVKTQEPFLIEYRLRASHGAYRWMLSRALPLRDVQGKVTMWVGTTTDIDALKTAEQDLQALNEELAATNEELSAGLEELSQANEQLRRVNADLDTFIYTASHDLRSPIANIEGLLKVLVRRIQVQFLEDQAVGETIAMMESSVLRFKETITDLTDIARIQKQLEEPPEAVRLTEVLWAVGQDLSQQILESQARIEKHFTGCDEVFFSRKNLKSILYNLLSNALKYRDPRRPLHIVISCQKEPGYLVLRVQDNGLGMDTSHPDKIFGMFKRLHAHVEGTGIGLYIVKRILNNAGGKIEVESTVGEGSTFRVYFKQ